MALSQNKATSQTACDSSILDGLTRFGDMKIQYSSWLRDDCTGLHSFTFKSSTLSTTLRRAVQREDRLLWTCGGWCGIASWGCNSASQKILFWSRTLSSRTLSGPVFQIKCWRFMKSVLKRNPTLFKIIVWYCLIVNHEIYGETCCQYYIELMNVRLMIGPC